VRLPNRDTAELLVIRDPAGAVLDASRYLIERGGYLARVPGWTPEEAPLPGCRRPLLLRYRFGRAPGDAAVENAVQLAVALGQARLDPDSSPLPGTISQIVRQGVTFTQQTASVMIERGRPGSPASTCGSLASTRTGGPAGRVRGHPTPTPRTVRST
jgi:hypothetical protein